MIYYNKIKELLHIFLFLYIFLFIWGKTIKFLCTCNHVLEQLKMQIGSKIQLKHKDKLKNNEII